MEASIILEAQKDTTGLEQCEGDTDCFFLITGVLCIMSKHH
jgi:hypothetical protein